MQVTPSGERPFPTPPTPNAPDLESASFANRDTVVLPDEMVTKILMYLGTTDIAVCRSVNRQWQTVIDARHLLARSFYRDCHLTQRINSLAVERNLAVERYHSHIRGWLRDYSDSGRKTAKQLDNILEDKYFPEVLFFSIPKLLLNSNKLTCQNTATIGHLGAVRDASFSPDGKYLVTTASTDKAAELWELEGGQWREKVTIRHSDWVMNASFSLDGKLLMTASYAEAKFWQLEGDQWQEKVTIEHSVIVDDVHFSPNGKHFLIVLDGNYTVKLWELADGQWREKVTLRHSAWVMRASFSPDGRHLVTASRDGVVKIWKLDDGQCDEKFTIAHPGSVTADARLSPDGKHLVTVTSRDGSGNAILWELVDNRAQERVTIEHSKIVSDVDFSPDGKHLVTGSYDGTVKICGLIDGKWQVKAKIRHFGPTKMLHYGPLVANASFSRDGKLLVTASYDGTAKICGLVGGKWQEIVTIEHSEALKNASFSPDYQLVTVSRNNPAKIWVLKKKENDDNPELVTSL